MAIKPPNINDPKTWIKIAAGMTGPGRIYNIADAVTEVATGTSITDRVAGAVTSPSSPSTPKPPRTKAQQDRDREFAIDAVKAADISDQKRKNLSDKMPNFARGDFDRAPNSKGGVVSYKSVFDME